MSNEPQGRARLKWVALLPIAIGAVIGALFAKRIQTHAFSAAALLSPMAVCLYFWIALSVYWSLEGRKASAAKSAESRASRALHLTLVNGAMILSFWPYPGWPNPTTSLFVFPRILPPLPALAILGVLIQAMSFALAVWARRQLGRNWSGEVTVKVDHELVRGGPYRFIRHPIYTGAIGMYLGPALVSGRLQGLLALTLIVIAYTRKIGMEERALGLEFGAEYDEYRRQSWALVPWVI